MRRIAHGVAVLAGVSGAGCFASAPFVPPSAIDRPSLESRVSADTTDIDAVVALASLEILEGRPESAVVLLDEAASRIGPDPLVPLLAGLAAERASRMSQALDRYRAYLASGWGGASSDWVETRLEVVEPVVAREAVRDRLASGPASPAPEGALFRAVVLPFAHSGTQSDRAISVAMAALLTDDLRRGIDWDIADPRVVRILLDELGADPSNYADDGFAERIAQLLGATRIIQVQRSTESTDSVEWTGHVNVFPPAEPTDEDPPFSFSVARGDLVGAERKLAVMLADALDGRRPRDEGRGPVHTTTSIGLDAYGGALLALDRADFVAALAELNRALAADPAFGAARSLAARLESVAAWNETPVAEGLTGLVRVGERQRAVLALWGGPGSAQQVAESRVGLRERPIIADALGLTVGGTSLLELTFDLPGGSGP